MIKNLQLTKITPAKLREGVLSVGMPDLSGQTLSSSPSFHGRRIRTSVERHK